MKIGKQTLPYQALCTSNPKTIVVRGQDLVKDLIGSVSFTEYAWLLVVGTLPDEKQRRILDSTLVAIAEHGLVPSVQAARMTLAASPEAVQGAVAAGLLGCGSVILGASEAAGVFLRDVLEEAAARGSSIESAAETKLGELKIQRKVIPGYGHPLHKGSDPRAERLLEIANEVGIAGDYCKAAKIIEGLIPEVFGKTLMMNVSSAIPSVLLDAGYPLLALKGVPLLARTAGLIGHLLEEQARPIGFIISHAGAGAISYDGETPDGFVADER
ncbi:citryl-CoA lyase (plasmid) [Agrobacterium leguminum]|uniref:citryl-CoA lyase n=1 Tax=Agrobacterium leguminum TaxID=2792015 RepID=UPI0030CC8E33